VGPVELSGLIFVALALVWAIVLIPMALKHHDEVAKTRAVDKFSDDMRVLARREAVSDREARLVYGRPAAPAASAPRSTEQPTLPPVEQAAPVTPARPAVEQRRAAGRGAPVETPQRSAQARRRAAAAAARRRRRILAVLLLADVVVGAGVPLGWFLTWAPAIPVGLTVLFLVVARLTVRRDQKRWAARSATAPVVEQPRAARREAPVETTPETTLETTPAPARNDQGLAVVTGLDDTSSFPVGLLGDLEPTTDAGALWDPLPVTLPTYVTKPRATRSVRTIDLAASDVSSSGRDAADSALVAEAATSPGETEQARRAVGS
jgi:hypothetical protein